MAVEPTYRPRKERKVRIAPDDELDPSLYDALSGGESIDIAAPQDPTSWMVDGQQISELADGSISIGDIVSGFTEETQGEVEFYANLADHVPDADLDLLAAELIKRVADDEQSMKPWVDRTVDALALLGADKTNASNWIKSGAPFDGAATVVHPMLAEAVVQFNARAMKELMPPTGPIKTYVKGKETEEVRDRAEKIAAHMNDQIVFQDKGFIDDFDRMLFYLPFMGSAYRKTWWDKLNNCLKSRFIIGTEVIVPYDASSLSDAVRVTHKFTEQHNELIKKVRAGIYRDCNLSRTSSRTVNELKDSIKQAEGREPGAMTDESPHELYEVYTVLDLEGFKDIDEFGEETGIALPYIVTIEKTEQKILSIYRNWNPQDELKRAEQWLTHYKFLQGLGMNGFGYLHMIGSLTESATGALRAVLDSAAWANGQSGLVAKGAKMPKGGIALKPHTLTPIDATLDDIKKSFYFMDFKEPSQALIGLIKALEEGGRRFMSTVDVAVGDANNTGPVGTTVALIEQAQKIMSGVHTRIHTAMKEEFRQRAELNRRYLADGEEIYFSVRSNEYAIMREDYDDERVQIIPVSDPNITSSTERIAKAQAVIERSMQVPDRYDLFRVERDFLNAIGVSDVDGILISPEEAPRTTPLNEMALLVSGKPIKAYYDQNHDAHLAVHAMALEYVSTLPPEQGARLAMMLQEHISKHAAYKLHQQVSGMMGLQSEPIDLYESNSEESSLDEQTENILSVQEAQRIQLVAPMIQGIKMQQMMAQAPMEQGE